MKINCIIVDDEPVARDLLEKFVSEVPALNLVGMCSNAMEASEILLQMEVHLIFLDINMPGLSGMKFYRSLTNPPEVIFTTAYPEYALEGYEVDAVDYLLKPFSFERFYQAVSKVLGRFKSRMPQNKEDYILLKSDKKLYRVHISEMLCIEGLGDYLKVHLPEKHLVVHDTMKNFLDNLPRSFIRVHKSWAVSLLHVRVLEGNIITVDNHKVPVGVKYRDDFLQALEKINQ